MTISRQICIGIVAVTLVVVSSTSLEARGRRGGGMSRSTRGGNSFNRASSFNRPQSFNRSQSVRQRSSYGHSPSFSRPSGTSRPSFSTGSRTGYPSRTPGSVTLRSSPGHSGMGDRQVGTVNRPVRSRNGNRQRGAVDQRLSGRTGDGRVGVVDRSVRVGDRQEGRVDRTPHGPVGIAVLPGLSAGNGVGTQLGGEARSRLSQRRSQFQQNRQNNVFQEGRQERYENRDEMIASRREKMQHRMENRDAYRDNRQSFRQDAREDWQDWADGHPWGDKHGHDHWHGNFGSHWDHMWEEHPAWATFRVTRWGINRASYLFGYGPVYYNPYPVEPFYVGETVVDYSDPLVSTAPSEQYLPADSYAVYADPDNAASPAATSSTESIATPYQATTTAVERFGEARTAFRNGDYQNALKLCDGAIAELPKDVTLHEFRSLILFSLGRYRESAAAVHAVLAVGPGMNWTTMSGYYSDQARYAKHLRSLEQHVSANDKESDAKFLLAYHYITLGHNDAARKRLSVVLKQEPKDSVAADLFQMLGGDLPESAKQDPLAEATKGTEAELLGNWKATSKDGATFELNLKPSGEFIWAWDRDEKEQSVRGVFVIDDGLLAMEPDSGGVMLADVFKPVDNTFLFRQNGVEGESLKFTKQ